MLLVLLIACGDWSHPVSGDDVVAGLVMAQLVATDC